MTRGGRRAGAGRKPSIETKQVRIPVNMAQAIRQLGDFFMGRAWDELGETRWFQTCPHQEKVKLTLVGVETRTFNSILGGNVDLPVLVAMATDGIEEKEIVIGLK